MAKYTATCPNCGRRFETTDAQMQFFCSVGCEHDYSVDVEDSYDEEDDGK